MSPADAQPGLRERLATRLRDALGDAEARSARVGLDERILLQLGEQALLLAPGPDGYRVDASAAGPWTVRIAGPVEAWAAALMPVPAPGYQSFTALRRHSHLEVEERPGGWARSLHLLERLLEVARGDPPAAEAQPAERDPGQIEGRYHRVAIPGGAVASVYAESAGRGAPVLFLHTAGADSRQYLGQLADVELARAFRLHAFDLPMHGRSLPADGWDGGRVPLTEDTYLAWCTAVLEQVVRARAIVVGCSMGAAMALVLAARRPHLVRGVVAVEAPFRARGRLNPYLAHAEVNASSHNPSYVRGLMSPCSPLERRRTAAWIYGQGGLGVYASDLAFYEAFDGGAVASAIDPRRVPVALLTGSYDYSAPPDDARRLADLIPGATFELMPRLGHFPMVEDPDLFRTFLVPALARLERAPGPSGT